MPTSLVSPPTVARVSRLVMVSLGVWVAGAWALSQAVGQEVAPKVGNITYVLDTTWPAASAGSLGVVSGVAVDKDDSVWIFRRSKPYVEILSPEGTVLHSWKAAFVRPHTLRLTPDGNVWVSDYIGQVVKEFTRSGQLLLTLGVPEKAGTDHRHFDLPTDIAVSPQTGDVFVTDGYGNARIMHFDKEGKYLSEFGHHGGKPGEMNLPHSLVMDSEGRLYEADRDNGRLQIFDQSGKLLNVWDFIAAWGLCITPKDEIWICGASPKPVGHPLWKSAPPRDQMVMRVNTRGEILGQWSFPMAADYKAKPGELSWVHCIAVDSHDNLYLGDIRGRGLQKFTAQKKE